jgi:MinD-like ATPase involved in chromosome partitioning or flagellar assembly
VNVPVLTAVTDAVWEADLVSAFEHQDFGVIVVRRCVDLADLLAAASAGTARAVILSADLRRLDRDALARLATAGVAVIGLVARGGTHGMGDDAERRLRQLGVRHVLAADAGPALISAEVAIAVAEGVMTGGVQPMTLGYAEPRSALPDVPMPSIEPAGHPTASDSARGTVVAVWGPTGAPGRTTVAITLATEAARLGCSTLLADADCYGGVVAQVLGLLDESPGLAAAVRQANAGNLDERALATLARVVAPNLRVLTGIARAERWPELRPAGLMEVYAVARRFSQLTVVDCGFGLEQDEELSYDTTAPRRNGSTLATLADAEHVVAVGAADPVGLQRLVRGLAELAQALPDCRPQVVVNRVRKGPINGDAQEEIRQALARYAGIDGVVFVPYDLTSLDKALAGGHSLGEVAPESPVRRALMPLAERYGQASPSRAGGRRRHKGAGRRIA